MAKAKVGLQTLVLLALLCALPQAAARASDAELVSLVLVGDVMLSRGVAGHVQREEGGDFTFPFAETAEILRAADLTFGNLESPISGRGEKLDKKYVFNAPAEAVDGLAHAGFDVVSLANNHSLDYGELALNDTLENLARFGIQPIGLTRPKRAEQAPLLLRVNGMVIGFLAYADPEGRYSYSRDFLDFEVRPAALERALVMAEIAALKRHADQVVVSVHWGTEYRKRPDPRQVEMARFMIEAGADVVVGHHPNVVQPIERYRGGVILYSLGNFVFDQYTKPGTRDGLIARLTLSPDRVRKVETLRVYIDEGWQPRPTDSAFLELRFSPTD